jgi:hypothetical protein
MGAYPTAKARWFYGDSYNIQESDLAEILFAWRIAKKQGQTLVHPYYTSISLDEN